MSGTGNEIICPQCGIANPPGAFECRACQALLLGGKYGQLKNLQSSTRLPPEGQARVTNAAPTESTARPAATPNAPTHAMQFTLASLLLLITLVAVCLGLFVAEPGLGIFAAIVSLPAFISTSLVIRRRSQLGWSNPDRDRIALFVASAGSVIMASIALSVVGAITFFFVCLRTFSIGPSSRRDPTEGRDVTIIFIIAGSLTLFVLWMLWGWARFRWWRDTDIGLHSGQKKSDE